MRPGIILALKPQSRSSLTIPCCDFEALKLVVDLDYSLGAEVVSETSAIVVLTFFHSKWLFLYVKIPGKIIHNGLTDLLRMLLKF